MMTAYLLHHIDHRSSSSESTPEKELRYDEDEIQNKKGMLGSTL